MRTEDLDDGQGVRPPRLRAAVHAGDLMRRQDLLVDGHQERKVRLRLRLQAPLHDVCHLRGRP